MQVVMRLLMDKGDAMLCEEYTYPHIAESMVQPQGYAAIPLDMDAHGIIPGAFRTHLQSLRDAGQPLPKLLYTIPVGQNPTGENVDVIWTLIYTTISSVNPHRRAPPESLDASALSQ